MRFILTGIWTIFILGGHLALAGNAGELNATLSLDTLYAQWQKEKKDYPFFYTTIQDLHEGKAIVHGSKGHAFGVVSVEGGDLSIIQNWMDTQRQSGVQQIYVAKFSNLYEFPYRESTPWPSNTQVECLADDYLMYDLGLAYGQRLLEAGFDAVELPVMNKQYDEQDLRKIKNYMIGLRTSGIQFYMSRSHKVLRKHVAWSDILFWEDGIQGNTRSKHKQRREFRKESGFSGFIVEKYDAERDLTEKKNQFKEGADLIRLGADREVVIEKYSEDRLTKAGEVKKAARFYFKQWRELKVQDRIKLPAPDLDDMFAKMDDRSIVLINDEDDLLPLINLKDHSITTFLSKPSSRPWVDRYRKSAHLDRALLTLPMDSLDTLLSERLILVDATDSTSKTELNAILTLAEKHQVVVVYQGRLKGIDVFERTTPILYSSEINRDQLQTMIEMMFGVHNISGRVPGYLADGEPLGSRRESVGRLSYRANPVSKIDFQKLQEIDSVVAQAIANEEMPGCQIMMVKDGQVVMDKTYGYLTYDSLTQIQWDHIYDIASVTKVVATVPAMMNEVQQGRINLEDQLGEQLDFFADSDKSDLTVKNILMHESGLKSYYPFWRKAHFDEENQQFLYKKRIGRRRYEKIRINWEDSVNAWIARSKFNSLQNQDSSYRYLYSDIGFMLMKEMAERNTQTRLDTLLSEMIYEPMSMDFTFYNPKGHVSEQYLVPTEEDRSLRNVQLIGEVHDRNAALLGGVSGHAGLFSNANDLAKYMQMMLQRGYYGGVHYFDGALVQQFTAKIPGEHRRALGWDKPSSAVYNASKYASDQSYGHSGFTGTLVWADPENDLIYIFLSNRVYPDAQNYKLIENNTRTKIHDIMYESIISQ